MARKETYQIDIQFLQNSLQSFQEKLKITEAELKQVNSAASSIEYGQTFIDQINKATDRLKEQKQKLKELTKTLSKVDNEKAFKESEKELLQVQKVIAKTAKDVDRFKQALMQVPSGAKSLAKQMIAEFRVLGVESSKIKEYTSHLKTIVKSDDINGLVKFNQQLTKTLTLLRQLWKAEQRLNTLQPKLDVDKALVENSKSTIAQTKSYVTKDVENPNLVHNKTIADKSLIKVSDDVSILKKRQTLLNQIAKLEQEITNIVDGRRAKGRATELQKLKVALTSKEKLNVTDVTKKLAEQENKIKTIIAFEREKAKILKDITKLEKYENELVSEKLKSQYKAELEKLKSATKQAKSIADIEKERVLLADIATKYKVKNKYVDLSYKYLQKLAGIEQEILKISDEQLKNEKLAELSQLKTVASKLKDKETTIKLNSEYQTLNKSVKDRLKLENEVAKELDKINKKEELLVQRTKEIAKLGNTKINNFSKVYGAKEVTGIKDDFATKVSNVENASSIQEKEKAFKELLITSKLLSEEFNKIKLNVNLKKDFSKLEKDIENVNTLLDTMAQKLNKPELLNMKVSKPTTMDKDTIKSTQADIKAIEKKVELYRQVEAEIAKIDGETAKYAAHLGLSTDKIEEQISALKKVQAEILNEDTNLQKVIASVRQAKTEAQQFMSKLKPSKDLAADYDRFLNNINQKISTLQARIKSRMATGDTEAIKEAEKLLTKYKELKVQAESAKTSLYNAINVSNGGLNSEDLKRYSADLKKMKFTTDENTLSLSKLNNELIAVNSNLNQNSPLKLAQGMAFRAVVYMGLYSAMNNVLQLMKNGIGIVFDFDKNIKTMEAVFDISTQKATELHQSLMKLGQTYGGLIPDIEEAAMALGRAGIEADKLTSATEAVMKMAKLTGDTIESSASAIITYLQVFGQNHTIEQLGDELAYVANQSRLSTVDINTFSNYALAAAKAANISVEAVNAMAIAFSNAGLNASTIGTQIRKFTTLTLDNSEAVQSFFLKVGVSQDMFRASLNSGVENSNRALIDLVQKLKAMTDEEFQSAISGMNILSAQTVTLLRNNADAFAEHLKKLQDGVDGELNKADLIAQSYEANWQKMTISLAEAFDKLTKKIFPIVDEWAKKVTKFLTDLTNNWDTFVDKFKKATTAMGAVLLSVFGITAIGRLSFGIVTLTAAISNMTRAEIAATVATRGLNVAMTVLSRNPMLLAFTVIAGAIAYASDEIETNKQKVEELNTAYSGLNDSSHRSVQGLKNDLKSLNSQIEETVQKYKALSDKINTIRANAINGNVNPEDVKNDYKQLLYKKQMLAFELNIKEKLKAITLKQTELEKLNNQIKLETNDKTKDQLLKQKKALEDQLAIQKQQLAVLKAKEALYASTNGQGMTKTQYNSGVQATQDFSKVSQEMEVLSNQLDNLRQKYNDFKTAFYSAPTNSPVREELKQRMAEVKVQINGVKAKIAELQPAYRSALQSTTNYSNSAIKAYQNLQVEVNKLNALIKKTQSQSKAEVMPVTLDFSQVDKYIAYINVLKQKNKDLAVTMSNSLITAIDKVEAKDRERYNKVFDNALKTFEAESTMKDAAAKKDYMASLQTIVHTKDVHKAYLELYRLKLKIANTPEFKDNGQAKALLKVVEDMINKQLEWEKRKTKLTFTENYKTKKQIIHFEAKFDEKAFTRMQQQIKAFKLSLQQHTTFTGNDLLFGIYNPNDISVVLSKMKFLNNEQLQMATEYYNKVKQQRLTLTKMSVEQITNNEIKEKIKNLTDRAKFLISEKQELKQKLQEANANGDVINADLLKSSLIKVKNELSAVTNTIQVMNNKLKISNSKLTEYKLKLKDVKSNYGQIIDFINSIIQKNEQANAKDIQAIQAKKAQLASLNEIGQRGVKTEAEKRQYVNQVRQLKAEIAKLEQDVNNRTKQSVALTKQKLDYEKQIAAKKEKYQAAGYISKPLTAKNPHTNVRYGSNFSTVGGAFDYDTYKASRQRYSQVSNVLPPQKAEKVKQRMFDQKMNPAQSKAFGALGGNYFGMDGATTVSTYQKRKAEIEAFYNDKIKMARKYGAKEEEIQKLYAEKKKHIEQETNQAVLNMAVQAASMLGQQLTQTVTAMYQAGWVKAKDYARLMKAMQIAQIAMNTASSAMAGWKLGMEYGALTANPALGATLANTFMAMSLTMGAIQMAAVLATKYHTGGIVGTTSPTGIGGLKDNEISAVLEKGEYVLTAKEANNLKNVGKMMNTGGDSNGGKQPVQKTENVIINTVDRSVISKWASSREGREVIHNVVNN